MLRRCKKCSNILKVASVGEGEILSPRAQLQLSVNFTWVIPMGYLSVTGQLSSSSWVTHELFANALLIPIDVHAEIPMDLSDDINSWQ